MILIISKELDRSTDKVIDWLIFYKCSFIRLNLEDKIVSLDIKLDNKGNNFILETSEKKINSEDISVVWYRKDGVFMDFSINTTKKISKNVVKKMQNSELKIVKDFLEISLKGKQLLGKSITRKNLNKLQVLNFASEVGLNIPSTAITTQRVNIPQKQLISKPISEVSYFDFRSRLFVKKAFDNLITYTVSLPINIKERIKNVFFPTLFQERLEKEFEIRVFHINGKNYSMAIFSQKNSKTQVDFRKYDYETPNRMIPFSLSEEIENKINKLMNLLDLDTGSIDLIYDRNGKYIFLEVNPVGQFGMVSTPCNYYLEKEIALTLKSYYEKINNQKEKQTY